MPTTPSRKPLPAQTVQAPTGLMTTVEFLTALGLAKALAIQCNCSQLSPRILLAGIFLAEKQSGGQAGSAAGLSADAEDLVRDLLPKCDQPIAPVTDKKLPLSKELSDILKNPPDSIAQLAAHLCQVVGTSVVLEEQIFLNLRRRATTCCLAEGRPEIGPDDFAVAGYVSFLSGDMLNRNSLSVHFASNAGPARAVMKSHGWEPMHFVLTEIPPLPLCAQLVEQTSKGDTDARLIAAVNVGLGRGAKLLELQSTAIHEAGHAAISFLIRPQLLVAGVSIEPSEDGSLGETLFDATSPYFATTSTVSDLHDCLTVLLAGGLAERISCGGRSANKGWSSDLHGATVLAWDGIANNGFDQHLGCVRLSALQETCGQKTGPLFDRAQERLREVLDEAVERAEKLLHANWSLVESIAEALLEKKVLNTEDTMSLFLHGGLNDWPGVCKVRSKPAERTVRFASAPGLMETPEGPVRYAEGDAIVTGEAGECWPIGFTKFQALYEPVPGGAMGTDGVFQKVPLESLAYQLRETRTIVLNGGRGILTGNSGDWIVDQGEGDLFVVGALVFRSYYDLI